MTKRVLLVEPSFYGVDFVHAAKALKCETICIVASSDDPLKYGYDGEFDDLIIADIRDANSVYKAIKESPYNDFDALIPCTDYETTVTAEVAVKLHKFGNSVHATQCARNKDLARTEYKRYGVPSAKYKVVHNFNEATTASRELGFPLVLKPTSTASSIDVFLLEVKRICKKDLWRSQN